ncbi:putative membrane protein [Gottschalkia acidurici 9a]|uniref:Membrane protein n=1 Tax=Gottschalkia acidurici (strain ATCC 7906 / DSM 604 / BCRC 14475 / CIP 104303 / KCTC 5404 / NCIMB 10678 / 9a) TaxID=1128398 RepID=K0AXJ6_GOTA9|nr:DUF4491 family protein [Gottschalkia acidurici]AFS77455.1 putative membrane protein [Gottschalkia acidurici 9a]
MNYLGILHGLVAFILIGVFHPIVIKAEYYLGRKSIVIFIIAGIFSLVASLNTESIISNSFGIFAFCCFWSIKEVIEQEERVLAGRFPKNPKRDYKEKEKYPN